MDFEAMVENMDTHAKRILDGRPIVYTSGASESATVKGIFDAQSVIVDLGQPDVSTQGPTVFLSSIGSLPSNPIEDRNCTITVAGKTYKAHTAQPDGLGGVRLLLHETE